MPPAPASFQSAQEAAKAAASQLLKDGPMVVQQMQQSFAEHFPPSVSVSATKAKFKNNSGGDTLFLPSNAAVESCLSTALDVADTTQHALDVLEHYVRLTIPKMEDGNNFGVTVQLALLKQINDGQDKLSKLVDEVVKYTSSRADAIEKCKLPSESNVITTSKSTGSSKTTGDEPKSSNEEKSSSEDKLTSTMTTMNTCERDLRHDAVVAVDLLYHGKLKALMRACLTEYVSALDFAEKNAAKLAEPRGGGGGQYGGSAFSSMY